MRQKDIPLAHRHRLMMTDTYYANDEEWEFLALGDTGDSNAFGLGISPQDAVARELANQIVPPVGEGKGRFVLHTGDVVYMAGESRLYERNFRQPYAPFLAAESSEHPLLFRVPFLPVPGNHDYYELGRWGKRLWRSQRTGHLSGLRRSIHWISHRFFGFEMPRGGSEKGKAFMDAFMGPSPHPPQDGCSYIPGQVTHLPHRYYQFQVGNVDFFALDSNTLSKRPSSRHRYASGKQEKSLPECPSEDYDVAQLEWLTAALSEAERERPENWRILFMHHPLYTTTLNHCEHPEVCELRANLLTILQKPGRVHLILCGHSHAFEWIRSLSLPHIGLFVTGGGGQVTLRSSVFRPALFRHSSRARSRLRSAGVQECVSSGRGPMAMDGVKGSLHHFLRIIVRPDSLRVHPIGVRSLGTAQDGEHYYRREVPFPVYHTVSLPKSKKEAHLPKVRSLEFVEVRRNHPPQAHWLPELPD